jgi:hypothetical protein
MRYVSGLEERRSRYMKGPRSASGVGSGVELLLNFYT